LSVLYLLLLLSALSDFEADGIGGGGGGGGGGGTGSGGGGGSCKARDRSRFSRLRHRKVNDSSEVPNDASCTGVTLVVLRIPSRSRF